MKNEIFQKIVEHRAARCSIASIWPNNDLAQVLRRFGLRGGTELVPIDVDDAKLILKDLIWKDMAYRSEVLAEDEAIELANAAFDNSIGPDAKVFTNVNYRNHEFESWDSATDATFDAEVLIIDGDVVTCVWFEDED